MTAAGVADLERFGEWFVVAGPHPARRANSVDPLGDPGRSRDPALDLAGGFFRSHGKSVLVKVAAVPGEGQEVEPLVVSRSFRHRDPSAVIEETMPASGGPPARAIASAPGGFWRGRAVGIDDWIGIFDLATEPAVQRRGLGRTVLDALLAWGADQGARLAGVSIFWR
ncbi:MAG: GNAT family N-acetyltransferase [Acidimicrobiia bacterium]|nr:GNAT family N-acetyltransferase [Acidimicrobiia bacterium]MDH5420375.1 GNAT family N-acetyltransferase [Acidimicrobiia bacterium]MDH5504336.1 GNAT family N-acetyltransferase [Acidimicrobiia bacterium]